jgi:two-component system cell cycle response regulator
MLFEMGHTAERRARAALLLLTLAVAVCATQFTLHVADSVQGLVEKWIYEPTVVVAGLVCMARGFVGRTERAAWSLIGLGVLLWGVGDTIWTFVYVDDASPPYPCVSDAFWLALYPPIYVGFLLLVRSRAGGLRRSLWLDGVMASLAVAALGTAFVFHAVLDATDGSKAAVATNLSYPLADLTLVALVVWVLALSGWRPGRGWGLITAGLLVFSVSDCLYLFQTALGTYVSGNSTDLGWIAGAVLIAWAAWQPAAEGPPRQVAAMGLLLAPVAFGLLALGVLVYDHFRQIDWLSLALASAAILAVIARMALTFAENTRMLDGSRLEARTDELTGLGNRRELLHDLELALALQSGGLLALFDLNGFKQYNDTFGHPAGDALLARLGASLARYVAGNGKAYRMGGDEFCLIWNGPSPAREVVVEGAAAALGERGEGFAISAAWGSVALAAAETTSEALRLADQRMYEQKEGSRASASEQSTGVLLQALAERHPGLGDHVHGVADLAQAVAAELGLPAEDIARAQLAASLHDVGKMAIPDAILDKPGPLDEGEWVFLRRHTLIGERILHAAPALSYVASIVRSTHERFDGGGYPDGLTGPDIPLAARIVFVCDAFDAMTSSRPYAGAIPADAAIAELRRCAGTQFDPRVVEAFVAAVAAGKAPSAATIVDDSRVPVGAAPGR